MPEQLALSVVIPTRNRPDRAAAALDSLAMQALAEGVFEVIVVDDGSEEEPHRASEGGFPFRFRFHRQDYAGAAAARNRGAALATGELLVFMDDDVTLEPGSLEALRAGLRERPRSVAMGAVRSRPPGVATVFARLAANSAWPDWPDSAIRELPPAAGNTQLLGISRSDFEKLEGFRDPTGGWPNWDDVDFGYRAYKAGLTLVLVCAARATHWDASLLSLDASADRSRRAAHSAARLFELHPDLPAHLPMFADKSGVVPGDPPALRFRKRLRPLTSSRPVLRLLGLAVRLAEPIRPVHGILRHLYRWTIGGAIYAGFQEGLKDLQLNGLPPSQDH